MGHYRCSNNLEAASGDGVPPEYSDGWVDSLCVHSKTRCRHNGLNENRLQRTLAIESRFQCVSQWRRCMCANNDSQRNLGTGRKERKRTKEIAAGATVFFVFFRFLRPISFVSALRRRSPVSHGTSGRIPDRGFPGCSRLYPEANRA